MEIYFSVSLYGKFVFRTDTFDNAAEAHRVEIVLRKAFDTAGFNIDRYERQAVWTTRTVSSRG